MMAFPSSFISAMGRPRPVLTLADFVPLALLLLVALFVHRVELFHPHVRVGDDVLLQNLPQTKLVYDALDGGRLPLWTPLSLNGYPIYAEGQAGLFYPPTAALHRLVRAVEKAGRIAPGDPGWRIVFVLELFLHHLLFSILIYLLARQLELSGPASLLASFAVSYGGFVTGHLVHQNLIRSLPYLPLLWIFSWRAHGHRDAGSARDAAFHGVALGLLFIAGHHQTAIVSTIAWVAFVGWLEHTHPYRERGFLVRTLARVVPAAILGAALAAVQVLPTLQLFLESVRAQSATYAERAEWSYTPAQWIHLVLPFLFGTERSDAPYFGRGHFHEMVGYVGIVPLVLVALMRPWWSTASAARFFGGLGVLGFFLAVGAFSPLYPLHLVPPLSLFRNPCRFVLFVEIALAFLSARALDDLVAGEEPDRVQRALDRYSFVRTLLLGAVFLAAAGLAYRATGGQLARPRSGGGYTQVAPDTRGEFSLESLRTRPTARLRATLANACAGGALVLGLLLLVRLVVGLKVAGLMLPVMCGVWLATIGGCDVVLGFATRVWETGDVRRLTYEPGPFAHIRKVAARDRVFIDPFPTQRPVTQYARWRFHAANLFSNVQSIAGYLGPFTPRAWVEFFRDPKAPPAGFDTALATIARLDPVRDHWKLSLAGVSWLLSPNRVDSKLWKAVYSEEEFTLYRNQRPMPRAFLVRKIAPLARGVERDDVLPYLSEKLPVVTLETREGTFVAGRVMASGEQVSLSDVGGEDVLLLVHLRAPGWLVLTDLAHPGWVCYVNGSPAPMATACGLFRAVRLDKGVFDLRFSFQPEVFRQGAWITLAALAATIVLLGASLFAPGPEERPTVS